MTMVADTAHKKQLVAAPSNMPNETFRLHMNHRHSDSITDGKIPKDGFTPDVAEPYRAFHRNIHLRADLSHEHSPEPPEAAIEFALRCLKENRMFGWREIAGTKGVVSAFPDGTFGIRFRAKPNGRPKVAYYTEVEKAAEILMKGKF